MIIFQQVQFSTQMSKLLVYDNTYTTVIVDDTMVNLNLWDTAGTHSLKECNY